METHLEDVFGAVLYHSCLHRTQQFDNQKITLGSHFVNLLLPTFLWFANATENGLSAYWPSASYNMIFEKTWASLAEGKSSLGSIAPNQQILESIFLPKLSADLCILKWTNFFLVSSLAESLFSGLGGGN